MRAGLYLRISKDRTRDEAGIERQEKACRGLVANLGWDVVNVYVDNDTSATKARPRPAYRRMLDDINAGEIDAIVAWQPDRLYRHPRDLEELVPIIEALRIPVQTVNAGHVDLSTSTGRMVARILGAVALQEVELKTERWLLSYEQGRVDHARPFNGGWRTFGYTKDGEIVDDEAREIRVIYEDLLAGRSIVSVCRSLNDRGILTTRGGTWRTSTIRNLLRNPRLAGHVTMRGEIIHRDALPAILTSQEHERIVAYLDGRSQTTYTPRKSILLGLAFCDVCDARLVTGSRSGKSQDGKRTYRCPAQTGGGCLSIAAEPLEQIVIGYAKARLEDPRVIDEINMLRGLSGEAARGVLAEIEALQTRLEEIERTIETDPEVDVALLGRAASGVRSKIENARSRLAISQPAASALTSVPWPSDLQQIRDRIVLVVRRVVIDRSRTRGPFDPERIRILAR